MLSEDTATKIQALLDEGYSQRQVALLLGVSRGSVQNVASGRWKPPVKKVGHEPRGERRRCPACGSRTRFPCTYCAALKELRKPGRRPRFNGAVEILGVELTGEEYCRYLQVKTWREKQHNPHYHELPSNWPYRREGVAHEK